MIQVFVVMCLCNIAKSQLPACDTRYNIGTQVGKGGQAQIVEATHLTDATRVVIKIFERDKSFDKESNLVYRIVQAHRSSNKMDEWRCLPKMFGQCLYKNSKALVMERLDKDLLSVITGSAVTFSDNVAYAKQILECVAELHHLGFVHLDLKPENVMLAFDRTVKIIDFGLAALIGEERGRALGTPRYVAPESVISPDDSVTVLRASAKSDAWTIGQLLFHLFSREPLIQDAVIKPVLTCIGFDELPIFPITYFAHKCLLDPGSELNKSEEEFFDDYQSELLSCCLFRRTEHASRGTYSHCDSTHWLVAEYQTNLQWRDDLWHASGVSADDRGSLNRLLSGLLVFDPRNRDTVNVALTNRLFTTEKYCNVRPNGVQDVSSREDTNLIDFSQ